MSDVSHFDVAITIRAETSFADPDTCKFTINKTVHPGGPFFFDNVENAGGSPLVESLFALSGVAHVLVADNVVTVGKKSDVMWSDLKPRIGAALRTLLLSGIPAILETPSKPITGVGSDSELRAVIEELLARDVNRSIAAHGGQISIVDVRDANLYIAMSGGCQGCASSQVTLRQGFEVMVREVAPQIIDIIDTTDHGAGSKPFYPRRSDGEKKNLEVAVAEPAVP